MTKKPRTTYTVIAETPVGPHYLILPRADRHRRRGHFATFREGRNAGHTIRIFR